MDLVDSVDRPYTCPDQARDLWHRICYDRWHETHRYFRLFSLKGKDQMVKLTNWKQQVSPLQKVLSFIKPGMSIFLSTGVSEPGTALRCMLNQKEFNIRDIEFIQLFSIGETIPMDGSRLDEYRLKTVFPGWISEPATIKGYVDVIPCGFKRFISMVASGDIKIDMAIVQISPPDSNGNCSFGLSLDAAGTAIKKASVVVGEITPHIPRTAGETSVHISAFDLLIESDNPPFYVQPFIPEDKYDKIAAYISELIKDGSCLQFSVGPFFDTLAPYLVKKKDLGIHSPVITDAVMDLMNCGAVSNAGKEYDAGKTVTSYAMGSQALYDWLNNNSSVVFKMADRVTAPEIIGLNPDVVAMATAHKADLTGNVLLTREKRDMVSGLNEITDIFRGAQRSRGGHTIVALPSRRQNGKSNITPSLDLQPRRFCPRELVDYVVTEYGVANLRARSLRERAQALIDIAHPDDRPDLMDAARNSKIIYSDQIYYPECAYVDPSNIADTHRFKGLEIRFRAIKPSDEEEMRKLFYRFSPRSIYYRYFVMLKSMPHSKLQEYVTIDCKNVVSVVGLVGEPGNSHIIAEARYGKVSQPEGFAEVAFVVEDAYQNRGIATFLYRMLLGLAKDQGLKGFTAEVLPENRKMLGIFEKGGYPVQAKFEDGTYSLTIPFEV